MHGVEVEGHPAFCSQEVLAIGGETYCMYVQVYILNNDLGIAERASAYVEVPMPQTKADISHDMTLTIELGCATYAE